MLEEKRRHELGAFLQTHRKRIEPVQVGLQPARTRRMKGGLRREELAALAGVSVTWYTRLEQGQTIGVSVQVVESLARVLQLDNAETEYLHTLARDQLPVVRHALSQTVTVNVQQMLDAFGSYPAYVINARWDVIAWNAATRNLLGDLAAWQDVERSLLWQMFAGQTMKDLLENWEGEARKAIAVFRTTSKAYLNASWFENLINTLCESSPDFQNWWHEHDVKARHYERKVFCHPQAGRLVLKPNALQLVDAPGLQMIVYTPLEEDNTALKLAKLSAAN